jgi:MraZ protein
MAEKPNRKFIGMFPCTLDAKSRLTIPSKFRELVPGEEGSKILVISRGKEHCLYLFTPDYFDWIIEQLGLLPPGPQQRNLIRYYSSESEHLKVDKVGRVQMSAHHLESFGLAKNVVVVGGLTHMEVWKPEEYDKIMESADDAYHNGEWQL